MKINIKFGQAKFVFQETLHDYPVVLWMDTSVRIQSARVEPLFCQLLKNGGILSFKGKEHSNGRVTYPKTYEYLPTNVTMQFKTNSHSSTMFYVNTRHNFERFMHWHALCALEKQCIAPTNQIRCNWKAKTAAACHRYDMSSQNVLLSNIHNFDATAYGVKRQQLLTIERGNKKLGPSWERVINTGRAAGGDVSKG